MYRRQFFNNIPPLVNESESFFISQQYNYSLNSCDYNIPRIFNITNASNLKRQSDKSYATPIKKRKYISNLEQERELASLKAYSHFDGSSKKAKVSKVRIYLC